MKSFKEWLLSEMVYVFLSKPEKLNVWIDGQVKTYPCDIIDMRFEDWGLESQSPENQDRILPKPPIHSSFSAPLADGRFINATQGQIAVQGIIDKKSKYDVIRSDWAKFADIIYQNKAMKEPLYARPGDKVSATG